MREVLADLKSDEATREELMKEIEQINHSEAVLEEQKQNLRARIKTMNRIDGNSNTILKFTKHGHTS